MRRPNNAFRSQATWHIPKSVPGEIILRKNLTLINRYNIIEVDSRYLIHLYE